MDELLPAKFWETTESGKVKCLLCPHNCTIAKGKAGLCYVRYNHDGRLYALTHGRVSSVALDPIEKKPLYHFHSGSSILSLGSLGCNFSCSHCQNWQIAQPNMSYPENNPREVIEQQTSELTPQAAVELAKKHGSQGNIGIAFTYNEPLIWHEYVKETAALIHEKGMKNVLVTNGFGNPEPLKELLPLIDALNIDIKAFSKKNYQSLKGKLAPVLETALSAKEHNCHIEITNLIIPEFNDGKEEITELAGWIADNLGLNTPLHLSRYFPCFKSSVHATTLPTMLMAQRLALEKLNYVHLGNV